MQETNTPSFLDSLPEEMQTPFIQTVSQTLGCQTLPQLPEQLEINEFAMDSRYYFRG